eukprot:tig00021037_g17440.t1
MVFGFFCNLIALASALVAVARWRYGAGGPLLSASASEGELEAGPASCDIQALASLALLFGALCLIAYLYIAAKVR